jgi:hypothetical protein
MTQLSKLTLLNLLLIPSLTLPSWAYTGSSFGEVKTVIETNATTYYPSNADQAIRSQIDVESRSYQNGEIPAYEISALKMISLGFGKIKYNLQERAKKTITEKDDYYERFEKLVHPNGICFTGDWEITEPNSYTGYFAQGKKALFIGRASAVGTETRADQVRGFGFAGKIFPTLNDQEKVSTANFFTVDVIPGKKRELYSETELTNEPETDITAIPLMAGYQLGILNPITLTKISVKLAEIVNLLATVTFSLKFAKPDGKENPGFRPLYPVAQAGIIQGAKYDAPNWIKINFAKDNTKMTGTDFRRELSIEKGQTKTLDVSVGDKKSKGTIQWQKIGKITLKESFISYGCDRRLHFAHPPELR